MRFLTAIIISLVLVMPVAVSASPGGLNAQGCHVCRTNCQQYGLKTGELHCHREQIASASSHSIFVPEQPISREFPGWATGATIIFIIVAIFLFWRFVCPKNRK